MSNRYGISDLTRLEERGWIRPVESKDPRQPYAITAAGKRHLEEELATLDHVARTALRRLKTRSKRWMAWTARL